jgi:putative SOS response-associated peptidase YedK
MCGRFSISKTETQLILDRFGVDRIDFELKPRYNVAPTQNIPVIFNKIPNVVSEARWGLIPHWAKDEKTGFNMINAMAETVDTKPAYKEPFKNKRCLVIADSFYEWKAAGKNKVPFRAMMKDEDLFAMAGVYDIWKKDGEEITTVSIITTDANDMMKKIHPRMPVIIPRDKEKEWLSDISVEKAKEMLKPYDSSEMKTYEISPLVNSAKNEGEDLIKPAKHDKGLAAFA